MDTTELLSQLGILRSGASNSMLHPELSRILGMHGRGGDDTVAHLDSGEIVIPKRAQTPELVAMFEQATRQAGLEPDRFVVGRDNNATNPRTGMIEFDDGGSGDGTGDSGGGGHGGSSGSGGGGSGGNGSGEGSGDGGISGGESSDGPTGDPGDPGGDMSGMGPQGETGFGSGNDVIAGIDAVDAIGVHGDFSQDTHGFTTANSGISGWLSGLFSPAENPGDRFATPSGKGLGFMGLGLGLAPGIGFAMGLSNGLTALGVESTPDNPGHGVGMTSTSTTSPNGVGSSTTASASDNGVSSPSTTDIAAVIERTADKPKNPGVSVETPRRTTDTVISQMLNDAKTRRDNYLNSTLGK